ncbi:acetyltransferase [Actinotignum sanguinis]|uniref:acyltransferase family protein n=1 Tax=Actinotignum sanguinis TaxID=1445614 RepID=UPI000F7FA4D2|nr:acyltransferase family protein [Actinotignum sanguinis]MDY5148239.1 acyltransferase family protein [Actinotignum sanguinis]RTE48670.1 acetyltransferase [Actinotignum sanguinis]
MPQSSRTTTRIRALDGIRALAIIAVVLYHMRPAVLTGGFIGVTVFFVLSGFLITRSVLRELSRERRFSYLRYLRRRLLRLWPPVLVTIAGSALLSYMCAPSLLPKVQADALPAALFASNWVYIFREVPYFAASGLPSPLTHLWYLGVLAQFYLLWPFILLALRRVRYSTVRIVAGLALASALLMALLFFAGPDSTRAYYGLDTRAAELLIGALAALVSPYVASLWPRADSTPPPQPPARSATAAFALRVGTGAALLALLALAVWADGESALTYAGGLTTTALLTALIVLTVHNPRLGLSRVLASAPFAYLGSRSFSLYLVHYPLLLFMNPATRTAEISGAAKMGQLLVVGLVAELFYRCVEQPSARLARAGWRAGVRTWWTGLHSWRSDIRTWRTDPRNWRKLAGNHRLSDTIFAAVSAVALLLVTLLAFAPIPWQRLADSRAVALRPELAAPAPSVPGALSAPSAPGVPGEALNPPAPANAPANPSVNTPEPKPTSTPAPSPGSLQPIATKVPANLDASAWSKDPATGICGANAVMIGDSVTLGATDALKEVLPNSVVDGKVSRQFSAGAEVFAQRQALGEKPRVLIYALGSNGAIGGEADIQKLVDAAQGLPVYFVTNRSPLPAQNPNNELLKAYAASHPNVGIIDWWAATEGHEEFLRDDGIHLTPTGQQHFATLIQQALCGA